jgi:hypothetical protein
MAHLKEVCESVHFPVYDAIGVEAGKQLRETESSSTFKFFVNVNGKTKLETNLQSPSLLPHHNTFEARALRVVLSNLRPVFSDEVEVSVPVSIAREGALPTTELNTDLRRAKQLLDAARDHGGRTEVFVNDDGEEDDDGQAGLVSADDLREAIGPDTLDRDAPPDFQVDGEENELLTRFIFNTVTTLYVGEKVMIEAPTWFFPGGAGVHSASRKVANHGEPDPRAAFALAEPVRIEPGENFRVEIEVPEGEALKELQRTYGPLFIWVVIDGFMTRAVQ